MSDTPKTDAVIRYVNYPSAAIKDRLEMVHADFARDQERAIYRLSRAWDDELVTKDRVITELVEALKSAKWCIDGLKVFGNDNIHKHDVPVVLRKIANAIANYEVEP